MANIVKIGYSYQGNNLPITSDTTPYIKEKLNLQLITGLKQLKPEGNIVYEYNPFRNYRMSYDLYKTNTLGELVYLSLGEYKPITVKYRNQTAVDFFGNEYTLDRYELLPADITDEHKQITLTLNNVYDFIEKELFGKIANGNYNTDEITTIINQQLVLFGYPSSFIVVSRSGQLVDFVTNKLNFSLANPVEIECQPSYDGSVNLILNDDLSGPKLINSRFTCLENNTYKIIDREGSNDTNIYDDDEFDIDTSLYKKITKIPKINFLGLSSGGNNPVGNYVFYFRLADSDGNETDFIGESGIVTCHIGNVNDPFSIRSGIENEISHKMIMFSLTNLDTSYEYINVYFSRTTGSDTKQKLTTYGRIDRKYFIKEGVSKVTITGFENIEPKTFEDINVEYTQVKSVKAQAQCQNMLFLANVSKVDTPYKELADLALRFLPKISQNVNIGNLNAEYNETGTTDTKFEYYNTKNIYEYLGYWDKEIYRLGIRFILNDYTLSPVFNIRGRDDLGSNPDYIHFPVYTENEDGTLVRNYIQINDDYTIKNNSGLVNNYLENSKGVVRINSDLPIIRDTGVYPLGIKVEINDDVIQELKKYTKGFVLVRQKRIPTILTQAITIGLDSNSYLPTIPTNLNQDNKFIIERFLDDNGNLEHDFSKHLFTFNTGHYKAAISPDPELNSEYYSQLFTGTKFNTTLSKHQPRELMFYQSRFNVRSFYISSYKSPDDSLDINEGIKITLVGDSIPMKTSGSQKFSARSGSPEEAWRLSYIQKDAPSFKYTSTNTLGLLANLNLKATKYNTNMVRGSWGTYLGIEDYNQLMSIIDIHIPDYNFSLMPDYFRIRYDDVEPFYNMSDWKDYNDLITSTTNNVTTYEATTYRGDCFVGNFTHRIQRNFQDPETPINDKIIDPATFKDNFDPQDKALYSKINRSDVNAVQIGHWVTTKFCSNINLSMRNIDESEMTEMGLTGIPRNFVPLYNKSSSGESKLPESKLINVGMNSTVSERISFLLPEVPYIKNEFDVRILYSDIHVTDAFKNSYRNFRIQNFRDYPRTYGSIVKLVEWFGALICVFEHGVALIPVNERAVAANSTGGLAYINTDTVLPANPKILSSNFGSMWADSIVASNQYLYGIDTIAKKIWRTNGEMFECISDFRIQSFLNDYITLTSREKSPIIGIRNVKSHFNAFKNDVMFTFYDDLYGLEEKVWNICFNEVQNKWITFYSWVPSYSASIDNIYFTFDRTTSKTIAKLGKSNYNSSFADGIVLDKVLIEDSDITTTINGEVYKKLGDLFLVNRNLPTFVTNKISYLLEFELDKDNYLNYQNFLIVNSDDENSLYYKVDSNVNSNSSIISLNIKVNVKIIDYTNSDLEIKQYIDGFTNYVVHNYGYFSNSIAVIGRNYILNEDNLTTSFWKHGKAGIFNTEDKIFKTKWYGKVHPFEFEFIVADSPGIQKIFDNLNIVSNYAEPESFHYQVVGESYNFNDDKSTMYFRQELTKKLFQDLGSNIKYDTEYLTETNRSRYYPINRHVKSILFPLYYQRIEPFDEIYDIYQTMTDVGKDYQNLSGSEIVWDERNKEYRIFTHSKFVDIKKHGIVRGNAEYKEDTWKVQIPSITFKEKNEVWNSNELDVNGDLVNAMGKNVPIVITKVPDDITKDDIPDNYISVQTDKSWSNLKETKIRDKYIKIKIRYSGNDPVVVTGIRTIFNISYA